MPEQQILYLSRADVEAVNLFMTTIVALLEQAFSESFGDRLLNLEILLYPVEPLR